MSKIFTSPLLFEPVFKEKIWGGTALREKLGKSGAPAGKSVGESWEISGWGDCQTVVVNGEFAGEQLGNLFARSPEGLVGTHFKSQKSFPLLFKFIDAADDLSIQVHPNSAQAQAHNWGDRGKTEAWYIVDAEPGTRIALGFNRDTVTREEAFAAVKEGCFESLLNFVPVFRGDMIFIPPGTVHAILGGTLIYEIQEESNTTLRLYDWNRIGRSGTLRELHVDDALDIINFGCPAPHLPIPTPIFDSDVYVHEMLCDSSKFRVERYKFYTAGTAKINTLDAFMVATVTAGCATLFAGGFCETLPLGRTVLIPAMLNDIRLECDCAAEVLITTQ